MNVNAEARSRCWSLCSRMSADGQTCPLDVSDEVRSLDAYQLAAVLATMLADAEQEANTVTALTAQLSIALDRLVRMRGLARLACKVALERAPDPATEESTPEREAVVRRAMELVPKEAS